MSEENIQSTDETQAQHLNGAESTKAEISSDEVINSLKQELEAVKAKTSELLNETKRAKEKARHEAAAAEQERLEKAKKEGDYKQLLDSSEQERQQLAQQLNQLKESIANEKTYNEAIKIASELADGSNAEILSEFIRRDLKYTDEGIRVLDQKGDLTVSSVEDLKRKYENSEKFKSLLRGRKASGGGAVTSASSAVQNRTINKSEYDKLSPQQKMEIAHKQIEIIDDRGK
jgi:hypothetical protein